MSPQCLHWGDTLGDLGTLGGVSYVSPQKILEGEGWICASALMTPPQSHPVSPTVSSLGGTEWAGDTPGNLGTLGGGSHVCVSPQNIRGRGLDLCKRPQNHPPTPPYVPPVSPLGGRRGGRWHRGALGTPGGVTRAPPAEKDTKKSRTWWWRAAPSSPSSASSSSTTPTAMAPPIRGTPGTPKPLPHAATAISSSATSWGGTR